MFTAWTNNLSDYEDDGYSDVDEEESDEEFNQKAEGKSNSCSRMQVNYLAPAISLVNISPV